MKGLHNFPEELRVLGALSLEKSRLRVTLALSTPSQEAVVRGAVISSPREQET